MHDAIEAGPLRALGFAPAEEAAFQAQYATQRVAPARLALALSIPLFGLFGVLDWLATPPGLPYDGPWPFVVLALMMVGVLALTWTAWARRALDGLLGLGMLIAGGGMLGLGWLYAIFPRVPVYVTVGLILVFFYAATFLRLRWTLATGFSVLLVIGYGLLYAFVVVLAPMDLLINMIYLCAALFVASCTNYVLERATRLAYRQTAVIAAERDRADQLLLNILPAPIAAQLKDGQSVIAEQFASVTVLFADLVGFTTLAATRPPAEVVPLLNSIFSAFDALGTTYEVEKIKTIGDSYMAVAGLPTPVADHAPRAAAMALAMQAALERCNRDHNTQLEMRIGLNTGPVVAGVIGTKKFIYDLWGDAVNIASRMESAGQPGAIQVSAATATALGAAFVCEPRGTITVKGKGEMATFWLRGRASARSEH